MNSFRQHRDLTWAVNSLPLTTEEHFDSIAGLGNPSDGADSFHTPQLDPSRVDREHLNRFLSESSTRRVGKYFERLILYWVKYIRRLEIVAQSLPIREGNRTVGEIDLLFRDEQSRLTHWEMAVKFYLYSGDSSNADSHFIGPNAADTFERKIERLFGHQLPRSKVYFPEVEIRQAFVKGRIFYHPNIPAPKHLPGRLSVNHLQSLWVRSSELDLVCDNSETLYRILRKPHWLSNETAQAQDADLLSADELTECLSNHFRDGEHPLLISRLVDEGTRLEERDRVFVVSDRWPDPMG